MKNNASHFTSNIADCSKVPPVPRGGEYVIDGKVISQDDSFGDEILISFACQKNYVMFTNASLHCKAGVWKWMKDDKETDQPICGAGYCYTCN